jgi:hypothetical protein
VALCCVTACSLLNPNSQGCGDIDAVDSKLVKQGYRPRLRRCEYVYCRNGPVTGSQLAVLECSTAEVLYEKEKDARELLERAPRH